MTARPLAALVALAAACSSGRSAVRPAPREARPPQARDADQARRDAAPAEAPRPEARRAVEAASALVGRRSVVVGGTDWGPGCAALVRASLDRAGRPVPPEVRDAAQLHALAERRGLLRNGRRMQAGDVVFLADRPGGRAAHAGLVARAEPDGTAVVLHRVARGVVRLRLNLAWPQRTNDPSTGRLVNDTLHVGRESLPAGSLVVGVADLLR
ncbi:MAG TPA: CHAP domain-containing protein [Anaeromyxobacteraceae bacterium]|jgi:cell wall-associated NlpC family hydrolase